MSKRFDEYGGGPVPSYSFDDLVGCPVVPGRGRFMQTRRGVFYPFDPRPDEVDIRDIAASLAKQCRFNGHTTVFYSVAQHSVMVSEILPDHQALWGLLHDAAEAYVGDMIRPLKVSRQLEGFRDLEDDVMYAIVQKFRLFPEYQPSAVKFADNVVCNTERRDLFIDPPDWGPMPGPLPERIEAWGPALAELRFLDRFKEITEGMVS